MGGCRWHKKLLLLHQMLLLHHQHWMLLLRRRRHDSRPHVRMRRGPPRAPIAASPSSAGVAMLRHELLRQEWLPLLLLLLQQQPLLLLPLLLQPLLLLPLLLLPLLLLPLLLLLQLQVGLESRHLERRRQGEATRQSVGTTGCDGEGEREGAVRGRDRLRHRAPVQALPLLAGAHAGPSAVGRPSCPRRGGELRRLGGGPTA